MQGMFPDLISLQLMLMDSVLALSWMSSIVAVRAAILQATYRPDFAKKYSNKCMKQIKTIKAQNKNRIAGVVCGGSSNFFFGKTQNAKDERCNSSQILIHKSASPAFGSMHFLSPLQSNSIIPLLST